MDQTEYINVWYDNAWPHVDVMWLRRDGYVAPTAKEELDVRVDNEGNILGFMLTDFLHLEGRTFTGSLRQVAVDKDTSRALHDKPVGSPNVVLPEYCGTASDGVVHFQTDESGDCIEIHWSAGDGSYSATDEPRVKALMDPSGSIIGFRITGISHMGEGERDFINVNLYPAKQTSTPAKAIPNL